MKTNDNIINIIKQIKNKDISVWIKDSEIDNRIDWIDLNVSKVVNNIQSKLRNIDSFDNVILLGMGGSSLAPLVFYSILSDKKIPFFVLDTINPDEVKEVTDKINGKKNIFIVSSKSGTTLETNLLFEYFFRNFKDSDGKFIFITDKGTVLDKKVDKEKYIVFNPNPNIGGRFSAFTEFGLVPSFLTGIDINKIAQEYFETKDNLESIIEKDFPQFFNLGKVSDYYNDYYLFFEYDIISEYFLGLWLEQLIAESTGKNGKGVLPIISKKNSLSKLYGSDSYLTKTIDTFNLSAFIPNVSKWMYIWFLYTSVLASLLKVNPFNQPDVQLSKDVTQKIISSDYEIESYYEVTNIENLKERIKEYLKNLTNIDYSYVAIQLFSSYDYADYVESLRNEIVNLFDKVVIWGFGPRYLHSIGQLYKGGFNRGVFLQIVVEPKNMENIDLSKPFIAQALGDLITMKNLNKNIVGYYVKT